MKITLLWSYYDNYIQAIYTKNNQLRYLSFEDQLDFLMSDYFGWMPPVIKRIEELGHQVQILIVNAEPLQKAWAEEHGSSFNSRTWEYDLPLEQVRRFRPDILLIGSMFQYYGDYINQLKIHCRKIFAWIACPISKSLNLSNIDCLLTSHINYQEYFHERGKACELLLPAFEEKILGLFDNVPRSIPSSFIGSLSWAHIKRIETVEHLASGTAIEIWGERPKLISRGLVNPKYVRSYWKMLAIKHKIRPSVWGLAMYNILARSAITVNIHAEVAAGIAGNMRMFEATGMGALLITEDAPNINEIYESGKEIVTYKNKLDLVELINYYTSRPSELEVIARAGQIRTLRDHSTIQRGKELIDIFSQYLK